MNKIYRIVQYIQPWEIDAFERQLNQLIKSSYYINSANDVILDCTMNLSIIDWEHSKLPCEYFTNKFKILADRLNNYFQVEFDIDTTIGGAADKRRSIINKKQDYIIWLDSDIYFSIYTLPQLINATKVIDTELYILTPQIIKYWDSSWDSIVADRFLHFPFNHRDYFDSHSLDYILNEDVSIKINNNVKFGAGWFNLLSDSLLKKIHIPSELGSYGPEDTYIAECMKILKIPQYILENIIVTEEGKLLNNDYIKTLLNVKISDKNRISDSQLYELIILFLNKIGKIKELVELRTEDHNYKYDG